MHNITLRSYIECDPKELGAQLSRIVGRSERLLAADFPSVTQLYATPALAGQRVAAIAARIRRDCGRYDAFAVYAGDTVIGTVSYGVQTLRVRKRLLSLRGELLARGPLVAGWLDAERAPEHRHIAPAVMPVFARMIARVQGHISGRPWTVVRPAHSYVTNLLVDTSNGFGGFVAIDVPRDYRKLDGVATPR